MSLKLQASQQEQQPARIMTLKKTIFRRKRMSPHLQNLSSNLSMVLDSPPDQNPTPAQVDVMLAQDLNETSMEEQEKALLDLHGASAVGEDPCAVEDSEFVARSLFQLEQELTKIKGRTAYEDAERRSKEYVHDKDFRLMFLRADNYHVQNAANRMVSFFEEKLKLFGPALLTKDITMDDLDDDDMEFLSSGTFQILPAKDMVGRAIVCFFPRYKTYRSIGNIVSEKRNGPVS